MSERNVQRIGILGGTFNPVHVGHLAMAEVAREAARLDKVVFVPCAMPPHKTIVHLAQAKDRMAMVRLAVEGNPDFEASDFEIRQGGRSFTIDTVRHFRESCPSAKLFFIIGEDSYAALPGWRDIDDILKIVTFVVVNRPGYDKKDKTVQHLNAVMPGMEISSSDLRARIAQGRSVRYLIPENVVRYIRERHIYSKS